MRIIKRLYLFVLKSFLPLFAMTFFIVLFIVLMQFLWRYIDDLVGKGLAISVLAELFFYAAVSMVPMALPLAVLLASLMTFGNLGERSELTAMKASGVSLIHIMRPLIVLVMVIAVGAFFFQNDVLPKAQVKMWTLLFSMKQKSPEVEIPEGAFYDQIPGYNLYVKHKNRDTGVLYDAMIYDVSKGGDNATILLADSARLAFTKDSKYLYLHLYKGEQFENLREQRSMDRNVPFRRESFYDKEILIPFDANFNRLDEGGMRRQYVGKNISELRQTIDSVSLRVDSLGDNFTRDFRATAFPVVMPSTYLPPIPIPGHTEFTPQAEKPEEATASGRPMNLDSLVMALTPAQRGDVVRAARNLLQARNNEIQFKAMTIADEKKTIRRHEIELIKKFTLSVACIIFFFIGAPLGAIIRKGGLGTPLVISVLLFLFYYIIDNTGYKMARDGKTAVWFGMWLSTMILLPLGIYVTWKAMNDSSIFNKDVYVNFFRKVLGLRETRHVPVKEVIINEISPRRASMEMARIYGAAHALLTRYRRLPGYAAYWKTGYDVKRIGALGEEIDTTCDYLSDCRYLKVVDKLNSFPVIKQMWIYRPTADSRIRKALMWFVPVGLPVWLVSRLYGRRLRAELRAAASTSLAELTLLSQS